MKTMQRGAAGADAMCITVGGDTFQGIVMMMSRMPIQRPLSLDLLWQARLSLLFGLKPASVQPSFDSA